MDLVMAALGLFDWLTLGLLVVGLVIGFATGAIPGLSGATTVALFLPISIGFDPHLGLIFMAAVYCGAQYGGAPPAILLNTPGEAGGLVTALDGYPMTQRGQGMRALGIARVASGLAGVIAGILVILMFQPLTGLLLTFGAPEMFAMAVFGLAIIASVSGRNLVKGVFCAALGVLMSLMSPDPIYGGPRLTFGLDELYDGFPFVPVLVGLFGISELAKLMRRGRISSEDVEGVGWRDQISQMGAGFKDVLIRPIGLLRGSLIGLLIGIMPGGGGAISNFISYGIAKRVSRTRATFGKGNPEGIIASETADNGVTAGAMVPTFGFGIPGSSTAAVMLSALLLHGITPGPRVLIDNGSLVYAVLITVVFASILTIPLGTVLSNLIMQLTLIPMRYLVPIVLILATIGTYSIRQSAFDVVLLAVFGVIGYFFRRYRYPIIAVIMGLILGPIAEGNFNRALLIGGGDWLIFLRSPACWVLWGILALVVVAVPVFRILRRKYVRELTEASSASS